MKTLPPPLGLLEFLERVQSDAKVYEIHESPDQWSLSLGCHESDILKTSMVLSPGVAPRLHIHPFQTTPLLTTTEKLASPMQVYLLTGYPAEWLPPFGHPHLFNTTIASSVFDAPCIYVPAGIANGLMALTPSELRSLTDFEHWSGVFAA